MPELDTPLTWALVEVLPAQRPNKAAANASRNLAAVTASRGKSISPTVMADHYP
jgi:hypothetical protein